MSIENLEARLRRLRRLFREGPRRLHFAGICGVSMSALAEYFLKEGHIITGSDSSPGEVGERLSGLGIPISPSNSAEHMTAADALITTYALDATSPECIYAHTRGIPIFTRAELLGALMLDFPRRIGISGSHGKSTTTAMIEHIFRLCGRKYTAFVGAPIYNGSGLFWHGREGIIYEACEYRDAFLAFSPTTAVITGVELDHTDYFADISALTNSFKRSIEGAEHVVINADYSTSKQIVKDSANVITYGVDKSAIYRYNIISSGTSGTRAVLYRYGERIGELSLSIIGEYNLANATAAVIASVIEGIEPQDAIEALSSFTGVPRRLEYMGKLGERAVYYDYAHHPTEIASAVSALRATFGGVTVAFRPHTYSRTRDLWDALANALSLADEVLLTDIYPAREARIEGVNSERLARVIGGKARYIPLSLLAGELSSLSLGLQPIVIMGAGDMSEALEEIKKKLK